MYRTIQHLKMVSLVHKSAKSTSQKHKTKERSNPSVENESVVVSCPYVSPFEHFYVHHEKRSLGRVYLKKDIEDEGNPVIYSEPLKTSSSLEQPFLTVFDALHVLNRGLIGLQSQIYNHIMANVSFDKIHSRWIAICDQLKLTTHAEDMDTLILNLEKLLNENDKVAENYQLTVNLTKFIGKDRSRLKKMPVVVKLADPRSNFQWHTHLNDNDEQKIYEKLFLNLEEKISQKVEEINEFPHINIDKLSRLAEEKSYTMPQGLTREQIIEWARKNQK